MKLLNRAPKEAPGEGTVKTARRRPTRRQIIAGVAVIAVAVAAVSLWPRNKQPQTQESAYVTTQVARRDITSSLTGSGSLAAARGRSTPISR